MVTSDRTLTHRLAAPPVLRTATAPVARVPGGLRDKLERLTLMRALMVTLLLTSAVAVNVNDLESLSDPTYVAIWYLIIATYAATVVYAVFIRYAAELRPLAYAQFVGDAMLAGGLVLLTGATDSVFVFLFFLSIVSAANLLGREGALFSASACSVCFAITVLSQSGYVPGLSRLSLLLGPASAVPTYTASVNIIAFYLVAFLAGHLAERLGQVGSELERRRTDIVRLRALYQDIVSSITAGLCTLDLEDHIISFNQEAERITGLRAGDVLGFRYSQLLPELANQVERLTASDDHSGRQIETWITARDGREVYVGLSVAGLTDGSGRQTGRILHFTDMTAVRRLREFAKRHERLAAIGQFSAAIAHEIRNPLASISGSVEMLQRAKELGTSEQQLMAIVVREIDRLNTLVEEFLAYARPRPLRLTTVDLGLLIEEVLALLHRDAELRKGVELALSVQDAPLELEGDEDALRQVLWNLLRNAAEAMGGGGEIRIEARKTVDAQKRTPGIEVSITDSGAGLTGEAKSRLFEPFFTTKPGGSGLGLAIVHRLIEAHLGTIWATDAEGGGTTFRIVLPVENAERALSDQLQEAFPAFVQSAHRGG